MLNDDAEFPRHGNEHVQCTHAPAIPIFGEYIVASRGARSEQVVADYAPGRPRVYLDIAIDGVAVGRIVPCLVIGPFGVDRIFSSVLVHPFPDTKNLNIKPFKVVSLFSRFKSTGGGGRSLDLELCFTVYI